MVALGVLAAAPAFALLESPASAAPLLGASVTLLAQPPRLFTFKLDDPSTSRLALLESFHESAVEHPGASRQSLSGAWSRWRAQPWWKLAWASSLGGIAPEGEAETAAAPAGDGDEGEEARHPNPRVFVNPELLWASDELFCYEEGCLSIPEYFDQVERPARVRVAYLDRNGQRVEEEIDGLYAVCFQHELDHLNGVLFIDHLSRLRRDRAMSKVKKTMRLREDA